MAEPIRVLRVIARLNVGGPALHVAYLSKGLDERGYETLLAAGSVGAGEGSMEYVAESLGVRPHIVPGLQRDVSPLADAVSAAEILRLIKEFRPHVLHTHTAKAGAVGRAAALVSRSARPPVVVHTFHGHVLRGYFHHFETEVFRRLEQGFARTSDALIAVSPEVRDDLVRLRVAPPSKIAVVRLGLDLDARVHRPEERNLFRAWHGIDREEVVITWLGRMTEIKRVDDLLAAFALLRRERDDVRLLLAGDGPLRGELAARAEQLGVGDSCSFIGFQKDVAPVLAGADIVALTSANEGTPVSLIEALAAERPVVSTDVGGVGDVVQRDESGLLVPAGDIDAIGEALGRLAADADLRSSFGAAGRRFVVPRYSIPRLVDDIDLLYRELLQQRLPAVRRVVTSLDRPLTPALPPVRDRVPARRLRVILVSQYFPPEVGATQSRMQSFAEHLAGAGHDVTVICEFPNHPHGVIPPQYEGKLFQDDRSNAYRILRVWVKASREKTQATRMQFYLSFMGMATAVAPLAGRADVVLATSPPLFTAFAGLAIARLNGAPFVLDVRDLWPAAAVSLDQIGTGASLRLAEVLERTLYRQASAVVAVTKPFCEHIDAIRGGRGPGTALVPNGTLPQFFDEVEPATRSEYGLSDDRFLVTFAGTHGIAQGLPAVLEAAGRVNGNADFVFVGDGPVKDLLVEQAERDGLANVHFLPQMPLEEIPPLLAASDALLVPLSAHPTFSQFVPSKLIDFMATGRPVIASLAGEGARLVERSRGGIAIAPEDPEALAAAVRRLEADPDGGVEMGVRARAFARSRLRSVQAERLEQVLLDIVR